MRKSPYAVALLFVVLAALAPLAGADSAATKERLAPAGTTGRAAVQLPAKAPRPDAAQEGAYGYRTSAQLAADLAEPPAPVASSISASPSGKVTGPETSTSPRRKPTPAPGGGAGASVVITATVLPVRTIVVDGLTVSEIWSNTDDRNPRASLYIVRDGSLAGPVRRLDADTWAQARRILRRARAATGRIY